MMSLFSRFFCLCLAIASPLFAMTNRQFVTWWHAYRDVHNVPHELKEMEDYLVDSGCLAYSSDLWNDLNITNIQQLVTYGFDNFKQTVATNYFTWKGVDINDRYARALKQLVSRVIYSFPAEELHRQHSLWTAAESRNFNYITMYYLNYMLNLGCGKYVNALEEPLVGNPPFNLFNGRRISQDIFNSLLEYLAIVRACPMDEVESIVEIGAGYGRTAFCFLSFHPDKKYVIVDVPPALYISQEYLTRVFPDRKAMKFRPFDAFEKIAEEFAKADLVFLTPDQLSKVPNGSLDLFLAIDCLHEMKKERVAHYFDEAERLSHYFYYKCWMKTYVPQDNVHHSVHTYPVKRHWQELFLMPCEIPSEFFHAMYRLSPD